MDLCCRLINRRAWVRKMRILIFYLILDKKQAESVKKVLTNDKIDL